MKRLAILISGRGSNMEAIAQQCHAGVLRNLAEICVVVSNRRQAQGIERAQALGLRTTTLIQKGSDRQAFERSLRAVLDDDQVDWIVLAGFDRLLSADFVANFSHRIVNIHPADPSQYRGLNAYRWAFAQQLETTTITVHRVDAGMDSGPILAQAAVDLRGVKSLREVEQRGLAVEHRLYSEVLARLCQQA